jgi:hypothetical protein
MAQYERRDRGSGGITRGIQKTVPKLTLDRTVRLARAIALVDYHARRNEVATKSHAKT